MKKSRLLLAIILTLALLFALTAAANAASRIFGDVDGDDKVTASDARLALRAAVQLDDHLTDIAKQAANVDGDDKITASDARLILRAAVSLEELTGTIHVHEPAEAVRENEKPATCTEDGSYDTVVRCKDCNEELSRETVVLNKLGHDIVFSEKKSEFSLTGDNRLVYECSRCGLDGTTDPTLVHVVKLTSEPTDDNMLIVNHFINRLKGDLQEEGVKFAATENSVSAGKILNSKYDMNALMRSKIQAINAMLGDDEKIPVKKEEFDAMLNDMMVGTNEIQNTTIWPVVLTNENFVLKGQPIVSALLASDLSTLTVTAVTEYDIEGFLPDVLPDTRTLSMKNDGSYWVVGKPSDYNLKTMFLARLQDSANIIKITMKLKDGNYNSMEAFTDSPNLERIIDFNKGDFEMEDISSAFDGMESIGDFKASQSNTIKTHGTVTYYFDAETGKPLAATYDTEIDTVNSFTLDVKIALSTLNAGASISADSHTKTIYIFDPKLVY
ncbi:MAG: dockerin type I repeat-containing protein [Clostridia bacterium]|nr:dockerin type I repeat-containing protein [Clostridia bacterium]